MSSHPLDEPLSPGELLFVDWIRRGGVEPAADFELFCSSHPEQAAELRILWAYWRGLRPVLERIGAGRGPASLTEQLAERYGTGLEPNVTLERPESTTEASSALLERLSQHAPASSRYRLEGEVARGGMGAILRVWDEDLRRHLAMKVVLGGEDLAGSVRTPLVDTRVLARFLEEAQVTGQLDHPGIVPVHELGLDAEGRVYFTMKLVKGRDLKAIFDLVFQEKEGWSETRALGVILKVCEAMGYAHAKGVIHRDLKPANVMVGGFGEVFVMDWGLARVLGRKDTHDIRLQGVGGISSASVRTERREEREEAPDSPILTMDGDVMGTPAYMPPEQARGEVEKLSPRSDVYAVGAMLYHLLGRQMPYVPPGVRMSNRTVLARVVEGPPQPLHELNKEAPGELAAICEKAMSREAEGRYADTIALAEDLRAYLEDRVVGAYETGAWAEARKWVQRNKPLAAALAAAVVLLVGGLSASLVQKQRADTNAKRADANAHLADERALIAQASEKKAGEEAAKATEQARKARAVQDFLKNALRAANPASDTPADYKVRDLLDRASDKLSQEFPSDPEIRGVLHGVIAQSYNGLGEQTKALNHLSEGVADLDAAGQHDSIETVDQLHLSAEIWIARAKTASTAEALENATKYLNAALEALSRMPGDQTLMLEALHGSLTYIEAQRSRRHDPEDPWPETTIRFIAQMQGRTDLDAIRKELNQKLRTILDLWRNGRRQEAKDTLRADYTPFLKDPAIRPMAITFLLRMGSEFQLGGLPDFAEVTFELGVDLETEVENPSPAQVLMPKRMLASLYMSTGRWQEARKLYDEILPVTRELYGPAHKATIQTCLSQARALRELADPSSSVALLRPLVDEMIDRSAEEEQIQNVLRDLAQSFEQESDQVAALECYRWALSIGSPNAPALPRYKACIGESRCLRRLGKPLDAEWALKEAWWMCSEMDDPLSERKEQCARALENLYRDQGTPEKALAFLHAAGCP